MTPAALRNRRRAEVRVTAGSQIGTSSAECAPTVFGLAHRHRALHLEIACLKPMAGIAALIGCLCVALPHVSRELVGSIRSALAIELGNGSAHLALELVAVVSPLITESLLVGLDLFLLLSQGFWWIETPGIECGRVLLLGCQHPRGGDAPRMVQLPIVKLLIALGGFLFQSFILFAQRCDMLVSLG